MAHNRTVVRASPRLLHQPTAEDWDRVRGRGKQGNQRFEAREESGEEQKAHVGQEEQLRSQTLGERESATRTESTFMNGRSTKNEGGQLINLRGVVVYPPSYYTK